MSHPNNGMKLEDLEFFLCVAEKLHFGQAARQLRVPASTLSRRIAALEDALGQRLLQRTSRKVGLTSEGVRLSARASRLMSELRGVLSSSAADEEPAGKLRVTAPLLTGAEQIGPALFEFAARYPRVELELHLTNAVVDLVEEGFDLAFRAGPVTHAELVARRLWRAPYMLAASASFVRDALRGVTHVSRATLAEQAFILTRARGEVKLARRSGAADTLRPASRVVVNDPRMAVLAAAAGLGIVCAPRETVARHGDGLIELRVRGREVVPRELYAVYPSRRLLPARVRLALDWVRSRAPSAD